MSVTATTRSVRPTDRLAVALVVSGIVTLLTLGTAFGLVTLGVQDFWIAFPVGFGGVLPIALDAVVLWTGSDDTDTEGGG